MENFTVGHCRVHEPINQIPHRTSSKQIGLTCLSNTARKSLPWQINYIKKQTIKTCPKLSVHSHKLLIKTCPSIRPEKFKYCTAATRVNHLRIYYTSTAKNIFQNTNNKACKQCFQKILHTHKWVGGGGRKRKKNPPHHIRRIQAFWNLFYCQKDKKWVCIW